MNDTKGPGALEKKGERMKGDACSSSIPLRRVKAKGSKIRPEKRDSHVQKRKAALR